MRKTHRRVPYSLHHLHWRPRVTSLVGAAVMSTLGTPGCSNTRERTLECHVQYADFLETYSVTPTSAPYEVPTVDVHGRFEFRAVYVTTPKDLAGLDVYVYQTATPTPALVHQLKLRPPYNPSREGRFGITGLNLAYDERARELQYWCGFTTGRGTP